MAGKSSAPAAQGRRYCAVRSVPPKPLPSTVGGARLALIQVLSSKWVNGTVLKYAFVGSAVVPMEDGSRSLLTWTMKPAQLAQCRKAFKVWTDRGIGIVFEEATDPAAAQVRIGFHSELGSWSYVGRDLLSAASDELTMNIGWDISVDIDTAVHEIGHTLGFPHEHQNPNAGIVWNEAAVYAALAAPPNRWSQEKTFYNIIRKISPDSVQGSAWDPNSVMHYPFEAGLIDKPEKYRTVALTPAGGLSARDVEWVKTFYPAPTKKAEPNLLSRLKSVDIDLKPGEQRDFVLRPKKTRDYTIRTFGESDTVIVLFEKTASGPVYVAGDDDSGEDRNAELKLRLIQGREYILRVRLYYSYEPGGFAVMYW
ncbi:MAG: M12 family metallopeptidase [Patescibacteria group bacterium]